MKYFSFDLNMLAHGSPFVFCLHMKWVGRKRAFMLMIEAQSLLVIFCDRCTAGSGSGMEFVDRRYMRGAQA